VTLSPPTIESTRPEKTTRSNSSRCPEGQANPVAAAASALVGSDPVRSDPVARPFLSAVNSELAEICPARIVLFAALGTF
jgi:hypothetical protein